MNSAWASSALIANQALIAVGFFAVADDHIKRVSGVVRVLGQSDML